MTTATLTEPVLQQIGPDQIEAAWSMIEGALAGVAERTNGRWTLDGLAMRFLERKWQLWIVWDGRCRAVLGTELHLEMDGSKTCDIKFCTGGHSLEWVHLIAHMELWAQAEGCARLKMLARKGWAKRLPDYHMSHVQLEKALPHG